MTAMGQHHTKATKRKMSESKPKRPVIAISMEAPHKTKVYESTREAMKDGFASSNITSVCKGRMRHCYGFWWKYLEEFVDVETVIAEANATPHQNLRPVVSIDPKTRAFVRYPSVTSTNDDGFKSESVCAVLAGRCRSHGQLFWRYAENFVDVETVLAEEVAYDNDMAKKKAAKTKAFARIDASGKVVKKYQSANDVVVDGFAKAMVYRAAKNGGTYQGFSWQAV